MKFSLVIGTYGNREKELRALFESIEKQTHKDLEVLVATQTNHENIRKILDEFSFEHKHFVATGKGPSNSRNTALKHVTGDILAFTDDDSWYPEDGLEKINRKFEQDDPDVAFFKNIEPSTGRTLKVYPEEEIKNHSKLDLLKQMSLDIYVNLTRVENQMFDERFGVNSVYNSGEDNIYLVDLYNKGYRKMYYYPEVVVYHPHKIGNYMDAKSFVDKGALFRRIFGAGGFILAAGFGLKKMKLVKENNDGKFWGLYFNMLKQFIQLKP